MKYLIAFKTEKQAYVLPVAAPSGLALVSTQPKFLPLEEALNLLTLKATDDVASWVANCNKDEFSYSRQDKQRIYCWWMGLSFVEREKIYQVSIECSSYAKLYYK